MIKACANLMALAGGFVLICLIVLTSLSVTGRLFNTLGHSAFLKENFTTIAEFLAKFQPITGDFELVEAGVAFAIMACLPLCQLSRKHAVVEIFTNFFPQVLNRILDFVWEVIFAFVLIIIAWRLYVGTGDKIRYNETTFMLQFPVWWGYAACTFAAFIAAIVAIYSVWLRLSDLRDPSPDQLLVLESQSE